MRSHAAISQREAQKNLAAHFPSSTAHGARVRRDGQPWPRQSCGSRHWLLPAPAPSCSNGGLGWFDWRPALPPYNIRCSHGVVGTRAAKADVHVMPVAGCFSSRFNHGRAHRGTLPQISVAASNTPMVSAAAMSFHVHGFQTFAFGVAPGWFAPSHSSICSATSMP